MPIPITPPHPTTRLSDKGYYERVANDVLREGRPMDAGFVWKLVDNVQHMVDESGFYRINWCNQGSDADGAFMIANDADSDGDTGPILWWTWFPTQLVLDSQYPRFDIRICVSWNKFPSHTFQVTLCTPDVQPPVRGLARGVLGTFSGVTNFNTFAYAQATIPSRKIVDAPLHLIHAPTTETDPVAVGDMAWLKLMVESEPFNLEEDPAVHIVSLQVREYLR